MYLIDNENVFFKSSEMDSYIHFGTLYAVFPTENEFEYEVRKFDLKKEGYFPAENLASWEMNGKEYRLENSRFIVSAEGEASQRTADQYQAKSNEALIMTALAEIYEKLLTLEEKQNG